MIRPFNLRELRSDAGDIASLSEMFVAEQSLKLFRRGDLMFARVGDVGCSVLVQDRATISPNIIAASIKPGALNPFFAAVFFSTPFGILQMQGAMKVVAQPTISTELIRKLKVPKLSEAFQQLMERAFVESETLLLRARESRAQAEQTLLRALGLEGWQPPEPLTYTRRASEALAAARFDAEYFAPRVAQLLAKLSADGLTIHDVAPARHEAFDASKHKADSFHYIEISGLRSDGTATSEPTLTDEAPSRASQKVHKGDIITSTVRPIRRLSAIIAPDQHEHVCSSGFVVLNPTAIAPEVLLTYLRLPIVCELMDLHTSASLYPAISERDILKLPIPKIPENSAREIITQIRQAHQSRQQAQALLAQAKRAVEVAIEEGEEQAFKHLSP
jgi:hypothetical protein